MQYSQQKLSEQDILTDVLDQEKAIIGTYSRAISETSCPNLRHVMNTIFTETCTDQYNTFDQMRQNGWYKTKDAPDNEVNEVKKTMTDLKNQIQ